MLKLRLVKISLEAAADREWCVVIAKSNGSKGGRQDFPAILEYWNNETGAWAEVRVHENA